MNWYFNDQGVADGPHDDKHMAELHRTGKIDAGTLVWRTEMEAWQEMAKLNPEWLQPVMIKPKSATSAPVIKPVSEATKGAALQPPGASESRIKPVAPTRLSAPKAPSQDKHDAQGGGLLKKLFGIGRKKA